MKKLIMVLTLASILLAGSAFAATYKCIMHSDENDGSPNPAYPTGYEPGYAGQPITSDYYFTIEVDALNNVLGFTGLFSDYLYAHEAGGWDIRDNAPFETGEKIFPNDVYQDLDSIQYDGSVVEEPGHGLWFRAQTNPEGGLHGVIVPAGIIDITFNGIVGFASYGPGPNVYESYIFYGEPVPIPGAVWLLGSGLIGLVGFRRKLKKS